ncbi:PAAR motif-containing protein [Paraburkholderia sacchari]|uniref:PAAR domain-containing protein n=1 Tax=Paraburkholderia sacchari TaxID=159450 RepID=UPI0039A5E1BF
MFDRLAVDGDRTTTGGEVIGRSDFYNEDGKMYARKENHATCGNCKGGWPIYGTASNWMDDGNPYVKDMDRVLCPCGKNFVLASSESKAFYSESVGEATTTPPSKAAVYDQQYTLTNSDGQPFANVPYRVRIGSEVIASGLTDSRGMTQRIATKDARRLTIEIGGGN